MSYNIAMISDFFYPQPGGVELHVYHLSQKLIQLGHSVVIITHDYGSRTGVRTLTNGLKVYYVPFFVLYRESTFPTVFSAFPILRNIFIRENIEIVHGHGSLSSLCHEAIFHARTMGMKTCFTDHSLFGFSDAGSILGNKVLKFTLADVGHVICVSHTCKENTVLRASIDPLAVSVIPNAVVSEDFKPSAKQLNPKRHQTLDKITIVVISRLFPNKGADLLNAIIPSICAKNKKVEFIIAGDGPRFIDLDQMIENHRLQDRVKLIGSIKHEEVRDIMIQGDIYLHASLTEAFGTVLVEAASCGLLVVTTRVGGIPEVLPSHMTVFANPSVESLTKNTLNAIHTIETGKVDTSKFHDEISRLYDWMDVAKRTENVYNHLDLAKLNKPLVRRLKKFYVKGPWAGKLYVLCVVVDIFIYWFLEFWFPRQNIDRVRKWPKKPGQKPLVA
ncbi:phosphatidylinositol N-acetylglucosaminyltransferase [Saccharomycopsis crataegensis]|uniref:Phosphatidylinositol N-acetylglucosaminyltransferase GPI3 subunit n=1 Tax=Saccharomycopsis crataegensis TaxID=43959 RepID=A0AAV5QJV8_9ASCO|nr:phosphatidylinositol N-acetylglucosaminyltransferase [Saccharomycopsis crataegensis]